MAGAAHGRRRAGPGAIVTVAERREHLLGVALVHEHLLQRRQHALGVDAAEHQRAPGDPQADAERRLVGAVAR